MRTPTWHLHKGPIRALSRAEVEDPIGGLIDLLDAMDGDPDAEPSLGAPEPIIEAGLS